MAQLHEVLHLLLVEDNAADVLLVREGLRRCGVAADVVIAYDGEQAERILEQPQFKADFIILDLNLPKSSGLQILENFKGRAVTPFIVLTSSLNPQDREKALSLGALEYVVKPASFDAFMGTICSILERWTLGNSTATNAGK